MKKNSFKELALKLANNHIAMLVGVLIIYFVIATHSLTLPGLFNDEAYRAELAMSILKDEPVNVGVRQSIILFGRNIPLMPQEYIGALEVYLLLPVFAILGVSVWSLRFASVLWGAISLILFFHWTRKLLGNTPAASATLLLATHPSFIFWHRMGCFASPEMLIFANGAVLLLLGYYDTLQKRFIYLAMLLIGMGIYAKMIFIWFLLALLACYLVFRAIGNAESPIRRLRIGDFVLSSIFLFVGSSLVFWYNLKTRGTIELLKKSLAGPTTHGVRNFNIWGNLNIRLSELATMLNGSWFRSYGVAPHNDLLVSVFAFSLFGSLAIISAYAIQALQIGSRVRQRLRPALLASEDRGVQDCDNVNQNKIWKDNVNLVKSLVFGMLMVVTMLIASIVTVTSFGSQHLLIILPFCIFVCVSFFKCLAVLVRHLSPIPSRYPNVALYLAGTSIFILLVIGNLNASITYFRGLNRTGGYGRFSDAIYDLADFLIDNRISRPITVDWGFTSNTLVLTEGKVKPVDIFWHTGEDFVEKCEEHFRVPHNVYIFYTPEFRVIDHLDAFKDVAADLGKRVILERTFRQRDGKPVIELYSVQDAEKGPMLQEVETHECVDLSSGWSPSLRLEEGWYGFETYETGSWRWIDRKATVFLKSPLELDQIELEAFVILDHFRQKRLRLEIFLDDTRIAERLIDSGGSIYVVGKVPSGLSVKGAHLITIQCDQSFIPDEVSHNGDLRRLSIIVRNLCCSLAPR
jgi:4-amino-4-deoxy-L-arabinose transferase-like glycosyltransferase